MLAIKITKKEKFNNVSYVDFSRASRTIYKDSFQGTVCIELKNGEKVVSDGYNGVKDWEEDFGFVVTEI